MNWLWINIPLMTAFFLAMTGIPLWLVFKRPDRRPAPEQLGQALPASVAARYPVSRAQTVPMQGIRQSGAPEHDEYALPALTSARP